MSINEDIPIIDLSEWTDESDCYDRTEELQISINQLAFD